MVFYRAKNMIWYMHTMNLPRARKGPTEKDGRDQKGHSPAYNAAFPAAD